MYDFLVHCKFICVTIIGQTAYYICIGKGVSMKKWVVIALSVTGALAVAAGIIVGVFKKKKGE